VYEALSAVPNGCFTVAAAFGNVHGVYSPGNAGAPAAVLRRNAAAPAWITAESAKGIGSWVDRERASRPALQRIAAGDRVPGAMRLRRNAAWHACRVPPGGFTAASSADLSWAAAGPRLGHSAGGMRAEAASFVPRAACRATGVRCSCGAVAFSSCCLPPPADGLASPDASLVEDEGSEAPEGERWAGPGVATACSSSPMAPPCSDATLAYLEAHPAAVLNGCNEAEDGSCHVKVPAVEVEGLGVFVASDCVGPSKSDVSVSGSDSQQYQNVTAEATAEDYSEKISEAIREAGLVRRLPVLMQGMRNAHSSWCGCGSLSALPYIVAQFVSQAFVRRGLGRLWQLFMMPCVLLSVEVFFGFTLVVGFTVKLDPEILGNAQKFIAEKIGGKADDKPVKFVFHGGSGSDLKDIRQAIEYGVIKMNIDTDTQWAYWDGIRSFEAKYKPYLQSQIGNPDGPDKPNKKYYDPRVCMRSAEQSTVARLQQCFEDLRSISTLGLGEPEPAKNVAGPRRGGLPA
ncbi:unnamed protein product, partial [Prorocentrum cordatum]